MNTAKRLKCMSHYRKMLRECAAKCIENTYNWGTKTTTYEFLDGSVLTCGSDCRVEAS